MRDVQARMKKLWCTVMHPEPMWPVRGYYTCPKCLHRYPVPWEQKPGQVAPKAEVKRRARLRIRVKLPVWTGIRVWRSVFGH